ncbi:monoamine oxidase [Thalassobacillus cyri]|uniref:Monoamine oxidase n=1 Tax=Thalassobacillus cyri TaxID=571932 RepID=A0A1H3XGI5_9BACI|nr:FAD-dependent oxidoreductase [Thalassobacillus cyri]SDZ98051.1 monoamine oxidase [Thalassobacillus cyri]
MNEPVIIVGAGLSGLRTASMLDSEGIECKVLEARGRIGGRVLSRAVVDRPEFGKFDLGPTWFWPQHEPVISRVVRELGLRTFVQHTEGAILLEQSQHQPVQRRRLPEGAVERPDRLVGGVQSLIDAIADTLPRRTIELDTRVTAIRMGEQETITLETAHADGTQKSLRAKAVILALPPRIVARHITFSPSFPDKLTTSLLDKPTWMAGQAKAIAIYDRPFWREDGLSGQAMSWAGPLQEIHDASPETGYGALFGFFGIPPKMRQKLGEEKVLKLVVDQLVRLYGQSAEKPISLLYKDWSSDPETAVDDDSTPLSSFPNYGPPVSPGGWGEKIFFAGTETASEHGGHLEGALRAAERASKEVISLYKSEL